MSDHNNQDTPVAWTCIARAGFPHWTRISRVAALWRDQGCEVTPLYSSDQIDRMRERAERAEALLVEVTTVLKPLAQAALVVRHSERLMRRTFADDEAFQSGIAWQEGGNVHTVTYGHLRAARTLLTKLQDTSHADKA